MGFAMTGCRQIILHLRPRPELGGKVIAVHEQLDEVADVPEARIEQKRKALAQQKECQDRKWWGMAINTSKILTSGHVLNSGER